MKISLAAISVACGFAFLVESSNAAAHARWKLNSTISAPRTNDPGLKTAPCGGVARTTNVKKYLAGQKATLEFEETVNHPGRYEVYLLDAQEKPVAGVPSPLAKLEDSQNDQIIGSNFHQYNITFDVPAIDCTGCAFQLVQVMLDNPNSPSNYYSCTDISISTKALEKPTGVKIEKLK
ncbi:MAG: SCE4755 family polysaccharide monooxygenase-like protein [Silvanigrellaceae bacterium]